MKGEKEFKPSIKFHHVLIVSFIVSVLFYNKITKINPNNTPQDIKQTKSLISIRILDSDSENSTDDDTEKVCNKSDPKLQEYYKTGDKSLIGLDKNNSGSTNTKTIDPILNNTRPR